MIYLLRNSPFNYQSILSFSQNCLTHLLIHCDCFEVGLHLPYWFVEFLHEMQLARHEATGKHRSEWHKLGNIPKSETLSHR